MPLLMDSRSLTADGLEVLKKCSMNWLYAPPPQCRRCMDVLERYLKYLVVNSVSHPTPPSHVSCPMPHALSLTLHGLTPVTRYLTAYARNDTGIPYACIANATIFCPLACIPEHDEKPEDRDSNNRLSI